MSDLRDQIEQTVTARLGPGTVADRLVDEITAIVHPELDAKDRRITHLTERLTKLQEYELGVNSITAADGSIDISLAMAHDMMRAYVAAFIEILDQEGGPNYCEMTFSLAGTPDAYTITIRRPNGKTPGEVATEQKQRAEQAEATIARVQAFATELDGECPWASDAPEIAGRLRTALDGNP